MSTGFPTALARRLSRNPGQPLVTFYDDATGERTELSATTYANWVAKTAGVLTEDLDLTAGDRVRLDLPTHWLGPVFLGAAWLAGVEVVAGAADAVVDGPGGDGAAPSEPTRLRCALLPFAVAAREPLAPGTWDFGTLWPGQPDAFLGMPGGADDPAYDGRDQAALLDRPGDPARVLSDHVPTSPTGIEMFLDALVGGGSLVLVAHGDPASWQRRAETERADRVVRAGGQPIRS